MDMKGEYRIEAPRDRVWQALNDPDVLRDCIPGCEELEKTSPTEFAAKVTAAVGPVKAKFTGNVTLSDLNPPESYTISGEGKGGAAGFAKGGAKVRLAEEGAAATLLSYEVAANVGGKLAQLGGRLIDGTAKKMADEFFRRFAERVAAAPPAAEPEAAAATATPEPVAEPAPAPAEAAPPRREIDVEGQTSFPPAQPSADAAAAAATGGPGEGMKTAARAEGETPTRPTTAPQPAARKGLSPVTWIAGLIIIVLILVLLLS